MPPKALILAGGFGTRLRPLTFSKPKPLVELLNKPMLMHQLEAISKLGVKKIVLAVSDIGETLQTFIKQFNQKNETVEVIVSKEDYPLGTAGPIKLAEKHLKGDDPIFIVNSDIICEFPLKELLDFHVKKQSTTTILGFKVENPSRYGVIIPDKEGRVQRFVEKPQTFVGNLINTGVVVINSKVLELIPENKFCSLEREIYPQLVDKQCIFCFQKGSFWIDLGIPTDYIFGAQLYMNYLRNTNRDERNETLNKLQQKFLKSYIIENEMIEKETQQQQQQQQSNFKIIGNVIVPQKENSVKIGKGCILGPNVVIGPNVTIGEGCRIFNSTILENVTIGNHTLVEGSVVGWKSKIGNWVQIRNNSVLGLDVTVGDNCVLNSVSVCPNKSANKSIWEKTIVL
ncbi:mannose-1-phosphate guanyltransferase beta [Anaeramoeba flamelloides]|uniref:mannose-1-phosphate guanylyltransferase n=1 Tax=Anaeramoeba flamelloides TaxID=1746091 RepID=A0AAV7YJ46_9EUKA|nr:mannose-1-phosphate guanyltransferase beta [Anaeramoeba flamelloides]